MTNEINLSVFPLDLEVSQRDRSDGPRFAITDGEAALRLAQEGLCSLCLQQMEGPAVFIGDPVSAQQGTYSDPPMHEACADGAIRLSLRITRPHAHWASRRRVTDNASVSAGSSLGRPEEWVMVTVSSYTVRITPAAGGGMMPLYLVGERLRERRFGYQRGMLTEKRSS
ncbi:hypothetical protein [Streptomyces sp. FH025]|uniref:hypothetical protein n=1 Tax=Streptomyces sp. FH025 TaxID=2815937 RepID=UPI001A9EB1DC|nr:hypothetical protein [Streptomyces sp. FH025]MBO1413198.1 hypothetical protein [Streptomyces sp. FH025]